MLQINKDSAREVLHALAADNNVSDSQMASWLFRNFYEAETHIAIGVKIRRLSVAITNLTDSL
jgi:hypothetical protein